MIYKIGLPASSVYESVRLSGGTADSCVGTASAASNIQQTATAPLSNSTFSFKHFLSSCSILTTPSSTVTIATTNILTSPLPTSLSSSTISASVSSSSTVTNTKALQTSTGARPKVPQTNLSAASSATSAAVGVGYSILATNAPYEKATSGSTKMKRSPRFSSFDSQACLADYVVGGNCDYPRSDIVTTSMPSDYRLFGDGRDSDQYGIHSPFLPTALTPSLPSSLPLAVDL